MKIALLLLVKLLLLLSAGAQRFVNVSTYKELKFAIDGAVSDNVTDLRIRLSHGNVVLLDTLNANGLDTFHLIGELDSTSSTSSVLSCGPGVASALVSNAQHVLLANLTVRHCSGPAIWLNSSISTADEASPPVTWELQQITFAENQAQGPSIQPLYKESIACTASALLAQLQQGSLTVSSSAFQSNGAPEDGVRTTPARATPAVAVLCTSQTSPCNIRFQDSRFANNTGMGASSILVKSLAESQLELTDTDLYDNNVLWLDSPPTALPWLPPTANFLPGTFTNFPAGTVVYMPLSAAPVTARLQATRSRLTRNTGVYGMVALRILEYNHPDTGLQLSLDNVTLTHHTTGAAALLAVGVEQADITQLEVYGNAGTMSVPWLNYDGSSSNDSLKRDRYFLSAGAVVALLLADHKPGASVAINGADFSSNSAGSALGGVLWISKYKKVFWELSSTLAEGTTVTLDRLNVTNSNCSIVAVSAIVSCIASVTVTNSYFAENKGGGLTVEVATTAAVSQSTFVRNVRPIPVDVTGKLIRASGSGAGLWLSGVTQFASVMECQFEGNWAEVYGGAAQFSSSAYVYVYNCSAADNSAGQGGGAFSVDSVTSFDLVQCELAGNAATVGNGGAVIGSQGGLFTFTDVLFLRNLANDSGGAVALQEQKKATFQSCRFLGNRANSLIAAGTQEDNINAPAVSGGGAVVARDVVQGLNFDQCVLQGNRAPRGAGGAVKVETTLFVELLSTLLEGNLAGTNGGAVHISNMAASKTSTLTNATFSNNVAGLLNSWNGETGYGGAVYVETSNVLIACSRISGNTGRLGGALHARLEARIAVSGDQDEGSLCPKPISVPDVPRATPGTGPTLYKPSGLTAFTAPETLYATVFSNNTAITGGAMYLQDAILWVYDVPGSYDRWSPYGVLFANNTAASGGAVHLYSARTCTIRADFIDNWASSTALKTVASAVGQPEASLMVTAYKGKGGALAVVGSERTAVRVSNSAFLTNSAVSGGAIYLTSSESCGDPASCYVANIQGCVMANNTALGGGGGAVYWEYPSLLNTTCAAPDTPAPSPPPPSIPPPPSFSWHADSPTDASTSNPDAPAFPPPPNPPSPPRPPLPPSPPVPPPPPDYHRAPPPDLPPMHLRACDSWSGNAALAGGYGDDVASTPFSLSMDPHYLDFYTSSSPIFANLSVRDLYGQLVSGGNGSVVIRAVSLQVFGQTYMGSGNGTALFDDLKLRAQAGWHDVDFAASTPFRELNGTGMTIYVRPCVIGEYLSPTLDQCLACSPGYYNFNHTAHLCSACSDSALCTDPDYPGMIVPVDGAWHSNYYSEQVLECPNEEACTYDSRLQVLSDIQQQVMELSRSLQASLVLRPNASAAASSPSTSSHTSSMSSPEGGAHAGARLLLHEEHQRLRDLAESVVRAAGMVPVGTYQGAGAVQQGVRRVGLAGREDGWGLGMSARAGVGRARALGEQQLQQQQPLALQHLQRQVEELRRMLVGEEGVGGGAAAVDGGEAAGDSPYGPPFDDEGYVLLLQAAGALASNYSSSLCSPGYVGVLCGSCAPGYGSTGPATCRLCPNRVYNGVYYALAMLLTMVMLAWTIRSLLFQGMTAAGNQRVERKTAVMGELRLMGRPLVDPGLMAVLDDDELPDERGSEPPIFGAALPPKLEGLVALRQAYLAAEQSFLVEHSNLSRQPQSPPPPPVHSPFASPQALLLQQLPSRRHSSVLNLPVSPTSPSATAAATTAAGGGLPHYMHHSQPGNGTNSRAGSPMAHTPTRAEGSDLIPVASSPAPVVPPTTGSAMQLYPHSSAPGRMAALSNPGRASSGTGAWGPRRGPPLPTPGSPGGSRSSSPVRTPHSAAGGNPGSGTPFGGIVSTNRPHLFAPSRMAVGSPAGPYNPALQYPRTSYDTTLSYNTPLSVLGSVEGRSVHGTPATGAYGTPTRARADLGSPERERAATVGILVEENEGEETEQQGGNGGELPVAASVSGVVEVARRLAYGTEPGDDVTSQGSHDTRVYSRLPTSGLAAVGGEGQRESAEGSGRPERASGEGVHAEAGESADGGEQEEEEGGPTDPRDSAQDRPVGRAAQAAVGSGPRRSSLAEKHLQEHQQLLRLQHEHVYKQQYNSDDSKGSPRGGPFAGDDRSVATFSQLQQLQADASPRGRGFFFNNHSHRHSEGVRPGLPMAYSQPAGPPPAPLRNQQPSMSRGGFGGPLSWLFGSNTNTYAGASAAAGGSSFTTQPTSGTIPAGVPMHMRGGGLHSSFLVPPSRTGGGERGERGVLGGWGFSRLINVGHSASTSNLVVSPRVASASGMPPGFMAEILRRQLRAEGRYRGSAGAVPGSYHISPAHSHSQLDTMPSLGASGRRSLGASLRHKLGISGHVGAMDASQEGLGAAEQQQQSFWPRNSQGFRWDEVPKKWSADGAKSAFGDEMFTGAVDDWGAGGGGVGEDAPRLGGPMVTPGHDQTPLQDAACIKIFISYVQILALCRAVPIPSPPKSILNYLRFYDQITAIPGSLVSLDCSLPDDPRVSKAMQRTILACLAPLYVSVVVALVWTGIMALAYRAEKRRSSYGRPAPSSVRSFASAYLPPRLLMSFATVMFYFYPNTVRSLLSIFSCVGVDDGSTDNALAAAAGLYPGKYWTLDYSEQCFVGRHLALALGLGVGGLLLIAVGWPLAVAVWLYNRGRRDALDFSDFSMVVYASYKEMYQLRFLYWESIIMLRQMAVAAVVVLLGQRPVAVQMLVIIAVIAVAFAAQIIIQPFKTMTMNRLEEISLVVIMVTLYLNLYFMSSDVGFAGRTCLAVAIIGLNAAMLGLFVYFITRTSWEKQLAEMGLDRQRVYEMAPEEIQASLRRRYGNRTAALLTRVVTGAQQVHHIQATMVRSGSLLKNPISSFRLHWSGRSSSPTHKGAATASGREVVVGVDGEELVVPPRRQSAPGGSVASGMVGAEGRRESSMRGRGVSSSSGALGGGGEVPGGREWAAAVAMRKAKLAKAEVGVRLEGDGKE